MGWWSESIMGGDTPYDIQFCFEEQFGLAQTPTTDEAVAFIGASIEDSPYNAHVIKQVTGFIMMERSAPMNDELRRLVLEGIDEEISEGATQWQDPSLRLTALSDFRALVEAYPAEGGRVDLPHQPGLFEKIFGK